jgi:phenylpropionate dioxygenase-like ring-hydroxylating dioxygenase large terminal subunit
VADVRLCGVNLNYWWPVAHRKSMPKSGIRGTRIGSTEMLILRDSEGHYQVFEDACPHKRVRLSKLGKIQGTELMCCYHGWRFDCQNGHCTSLDAMPGQERCFDLKTFPVKEYGGWIWAFPGDPHLAEQSTFVNIPPANQPGKFYSLPMEGRVNCHFSYITENATDLYHAELHTAQQPWQNPMLVSLKEEERTVYARYEVEATRLLASLFTGRGKKYIQVRYEYPYIHIYDEEGGFYLFVGYLPQDPQNTFVFSTFYFPHILSNELLSKMLLPFFESILTPILNQGTFRKVFQEDIFAVEEEQRAYNLYQEDLSRDTNPVSHAVRRVIIRQTTDQLLLKPQPIITNPGCPL